jgi:hypothetical protein
MDEKVPTNLEEALLRIAELEKENAKSKILMEKKKNMENHTRKFEFDPRHHLPETAFRITQETANQHAAELKKLLIRLEQNPPPKVAPASPTTAARDKKFIADALNAPLDIEHSNSYSLPSINVYKEKQET